MKTNTIWAALIIMVAVTAVLPGCAGSGKAVGQTEGAYTIEIEAGDEWLHRFKIFPGIYIKNPPQYAVWLEDLDGNYIDTVMVTEKIAEEKWSFNGGNRRIEALPYWMFRRGVVYSDGLMLPNSNNKMPDSVTAASARSDSALDINPDSAGGNTALRIVAEFNHSTDFNEAWPADAVPGGKSWSGGEYGSGQPAVVYSAEFKPADPGFKTIELVLEGCSSADGSNGEINPDLTGLTTALEIVRKISLRQN